MREGEKQEKSKLLLLNWDHFWFITILKQTYFAWLKHKFSVFFFLLLFEKKTTVQNYTSFFFVFSFNTTFLYS